ncbi:polyketide cyclase [Jatrophihabitans sp. DSM 45814]
MYEQSATQLKVTQKTEADASAIFAILADPRRHAEIDGSAMLVAAVGSTVITGVGEMFTMQMHIDGIGDYRTENHVVEFVKDRRIAWMTAGVGRPPSGQHWSWQLEPLPGGGCAVVHVYDWSRVTNPKMLERVSFPLVPAADLEQTIARLIGVSV